MKKITKISRKERLVDHIAQDVGMMQAVRSKDNAITILCDMLYYTNLRTRWHQDTIEAIKGICPEYFNNLDPK